ncbi:ABC transporter ATP-binding protein [Ammoniphilus sp. CFH 90114]|uniref:ABC transporter ATP-binding protein n=1 Tax=Ammoniphilus sp. CFH 90114 TaxID=2493665 RepID=UPI00100F0DF3|nr:ABC transporter ATP-binding protein [Ammoniphilus sp. CFH 90114]RXT15468.1 ABC transporter ATP-binding protein [Ammoniphilus sp. CFH 90114]
MTVVDVCSVSFQYGRKQKPVFRDLTFSIEKGEIVGVIGASGSGKSTLLRVIAGLEHPSEGKVILSGKTVVDDNICLNPEQRGVGMVFQDYALFPHLTVAQNVAFGLHRLPRSERTVRVQEMLELVHLSEYKDRYPHELSGGQQQRVAIARALAPRPSLLLMDEPFSNLDADLKSSIRCEIQDILRKAEMTCLFVTHDHQDVEAICDRAIKMQAS